MWLFAHESQQTRFSQLSIFQVFRKAEEKTLQVTQSPSNFVNIVLRSIALITSAISKQDKSFELRFKWKMGRRATSFSSFE